MDQSRSRFLEEVGFSALKKEERKMELQKSDVWPPTWGGWYGKGSKLASGEEPERVTSIRADDQAVILEVEYAGQELTGYIYLQDKASREKVLKALAPHVGKSVREIGSIDVDL